MPDKTWKAAERRVARMVNTKRVGPRGDTSFDVVAAPEYNFGGCELGIEVKYRKKFPAWLREFIEQAEQHREKTLPTADPIVVLVEKGQREEDFLCLMPFSSYLLLRIDSNER
jgi:hypothetical protein